MPTIRDVLTKTEAWFEQRGLDRPRHAAQEIVALGLGLERLQLVLQYDKPLSDDELAQVRAVVKRRAAGEPLQYIEGSAGFHAYEFTVKPGVLCPRPDTETLVDAALKLIEEGDGDPVYVADVGTGTGCVGLTIAAQRPRVRLYATDVSPVALAVTKENLAALGLEGRVGVLEGSLLSPIPERRPIDIVVSNPPYIPTATIDTLAPEVRDHEPRLALDGGPDGLDIYRQLVPQAARRARVAVLMEIGHDQGPAVAELFRQAGLHHVSVLRDLGRNDRVVQGFKAKQPTEGESPVSQDGAPEAVVDDTSEAEHTPARVRW